MTVAGSTFATETQKVQVCPAGSELPRTAQGVRTDPVKLKAVREFPTPVDVRTLRSFLGLASYSKVASPLHTLTKKDVAYEWTPQCQQAYDQLKEMLVTAPLLAFPNFDSPFMMETDASGLGLGLNARKMARCIPLPTPVAVSNRMRKTTVSQSWRV